MDKKYDVVIIGAGIGGLVCGCYLAKAGLKVLICEQHSIPGGYCTSFKRKGFIFDAGVHSLGSLRKNGMLYTILSDLKLLGKIQFITTKMIDRIITPTTKFYISRNKNHTKKVLIKQFPGEKDGINKFFDFIDGGDLLYTISKTKKINFKDLLDRYLINEDLKTVLSIPLTNIGLPASKASALVAVFLYREFIFDGGYYPRGGIQQLPNLLCSSFIALGGNIKFSSKVVKIITRYNKVDGVKLVNNQIIKANFIVSNIDARLTFHKLLGGSTQESRQIRKLTESLSAFVVYIGLKRKINDIPRHFNTWYLARGNFEDCFKFNKNLHGLSNFDYILCTFPSLVDASLAPNGKDSVRLFALAKYANKKTWDKYKHIFSDRLIKAASAVIPDLKELIEYVEIATPCTFEGYTSNRHGALFGWAAQKGQIDPNLLPQQTSITNLYLAGHWVMNGIGQSGIPVVALSGKNAARRIIREIKRK